MGMYNILDFGAKENELCTEALQAAFDKASNEGGIVFVPGGTFVSGYINMGCASLFLEKGAILRASANFNDYNDGVSIFDDENKKTYPLLYSENSDGVRIYGDGIIDLNGESFENRRSAENAAELSEKVSSIQDPTQVICFNGESHEIVFYKCSRLRIDGIKVMNALVHSVNTVNCNDIKISDVTLENDLNNENAYGFCFSSSSDIIINGCNITSGDNCISLSGIGLAGASCENVTISNCIIKSSGKAISIGAYDSTVKNVAVTNCVIATSNRGVSICATPGDALIENILCSNLSIYTEISDDDILGNGEPICIICNRHDSLINSDIPYDSKKINIKNIRFSNIICDAANAIGIVGEGGNVRDITITRITFSLHKNKDITGRGRLLDLAHGKRSASLPFDSKNYWLYVSDAKNILINDASVDMYKDECLYYHKENCPQVQILERW